MFVPDAVDDVSTAAENNTDDAADNVSDSVENATDEADNVSDAVTDTTNQTTDDVGNATGAIEDTVNETTADSIVGLVNETEDMADETLDVLEAASNDTTHDDQLLATIPGPDSTVVVVLQRSEIFDATIGDHRMRTIVTNTSSDVWELVDPTILDQERLSLELNHSTNNGTAGTPVSIDERPHLDGGEDPTVRTTRDREHVNVAAFIFHPSATTTAAESTPNASIVDARTDHSHQEASPTADLDASDGVYSAMTAILTPLRSPVSLVIGSVGLSAAAVALSSGTLSFSLVRSLLTGPARRAVTAPPRFIGMMLRFGRSNDVDPLKNDQRVDIFSAISDSPGLYLSLIEPETDIPLSTAPHHLRILEDEGLVRSDLFRGKRRYYPIHTEQLKLTAPLAEEPTRRILTALAGLDMATNRVLAEAVDRSPGTVSHHLRRLEEIGLIVRNQQGRSTANRLPAEVAQVLADSEPSHVKDGPFSD